MKIQAVLLITLLISVVAVLSAPAELASDEQMNIRMRRESCFIPHDPHNIFCISGCRHFGYKSGYCKAGRCHCTH